MKPDWKHEYPNKEGWYWFAGERYKRNNFAKANGEKPRYELSLCECRKYGKGKDSGFIVTGNGQFLYKSELGDEWLFAPANIPAMPKFKEAGQ